MADTPISTTGAENDMGLYFTRLTVKAKSVSFAADGLSYAQRYNIAKGGMFGLFLLFIFKFLFPITSELVHSHIR